MKSIRLDKYLADMGMGTRKTVKDCIRRGRVTVNGTCVLDAGMKIFTESDQVVYDGKPVRYVEYEYYMLHKPAGVLSASNDPHARTVLDLIDEKVRKDLSPAGRLDKDTEGLLLITNDGKLIHELISPARHVSKLYYAVVNGRVSEADAACFARGLYVDEELTARPAALTVLCIDEEARTSEVLVELTEGKFHQVKRMFAAIQKPVIYLKRLTFGPLRLDEALPVGACRPLTQEERETLKSLRGRPEQQGGVFVQPDACRDNLFYSPMHPDGVSHIDPDLCRAGEIGDRFQAVIFDLDGTLVDSMGIWHEIDIRYLQRFGLETPPDLQASIAGISVVQTARYFQDRFNITDSVEQIIADWNEMAGEKYKQEICIKPGAREFLKYLKGRGIATAIATSNTTELAVNVLRKNQIEAYFDCIITGEDIHNGKPAPDIYLETARRLGVCAQACLVFEDIPHGIRAALAAGMTCIAVSDPHAQKYREEILDLADGYIRDYYDLFLT